MVLLALAADLAAVTVPAEPVALPEERPADLLAAPRKVFTGCWTETWRKGPAAARRESALRRAMPTVQRESGKRSHRPTCEPGSARETIPTVTLTYSAPPGARVPALG